MNLISPEAKAWGKELRRIIAEGLACKWPATAAHVLHVPRDFPQITLREEEYPKTKKGLVWARNEAYRRSKKKADTESVIASLRASHYDKGEVMGYLNGLMELAAEFDESKGHLTGDMNGLRDAVTNKLKTVPLAILQGVRDAPDVDEARNEVKQVPVSEKLHAVTKESLNEALSKAEEKLDSVLREAIGNAYADISPTNPKFKLDGIDTPEGKNKLKGKLRLAAVCDALNCSMPGGVDRRVVFHEARAKLSVKNN